MKVSFPYTYGGSGSDVWTQTLAKALEKKGVTTELLEYPKVYQGCPPLIKCAQFKTDADIIHTNSWTGIGFCNSSVPHVTTEHHVVHDKLLTPYKSLAQKAFHKAVYFYEKKSLDNADVITVPSSYTKKKVKEIFDKESRLIYNGVDVSLFKPLGKSLNLDAKNNNKIKLFFVGNLSKRKGADLLPYIMDRLGSNFVLYTTANLPSLSSSSKIISIGKVGADKLVQWYNYCDIFLSPSRMEGFGLTICEAMACGKPVVTTNVTAMPELITSEKGGYLCEIDNVQDFVDKIVRLTDCQRTRENYGQYNHEKATKLFTLDKMVDQYISCYESLL